MSRTYISRVMRRRLYFNRSRSLYTRTRIRCPSPRLKTSQKSYESDDFEVHVDHATSFSPVERRRGLDAQQYVTIAVVVSNDICSSSIFNAMRNVACFGVWKPTRKRSRLVSLRRLVHVAHVRHFAHKATLKRTWINTETRLHVCTGACSSCAVRSVFAFLWKPRSPKRTRTVLRIGFCFIVSPKVLTIFRQTRNVYLVGRGSR